MDVLRYPERVKTLTLASPFGVADRHAEVINSVKYVIQSVKPVIKCEKKRDNSVKQYGKV
jgi:hypothetical protein